MSDAWGGSWASAWGVAWGAGVVPPTPPPAWQPAQGSQGGSTMRTGRLARPAGRFGEDHAKYPGSNVPDNVRLPAPIVDERLPIADISADVVEYATLTDRIASLDRAEIAETQRAAKIDKRIADMAAKADAERLQIEAEEEEIAMLLIAIGACV